jgi:hypothetical protein
MLSRVKAVSQAQYAKWLHTLQTLVKAHPSSLPKLPSQEGSARTNVN